MRVMVVPLGGLHSAADEVELLFRGRNAAPRLLLEGVQDIDGGLEPNRVDGPEVVAVVARDHLQDKDSGSITCPSEGDRPDEKARATIGGSGVVKA